MKRYFTFTLLFILVASHNVQSQIDEIESDQPKLEEAVFNENVEYTFLITKNFPSGKIAQRLMYKNKKLTGEVSITNDGSNKTIIEIGYDEQQRIIQINTRNNKNWTNQKNKYLRDNLLLSEFIVQYDGVKKDTIHYTYEYKNKTSNPIVFYRLRNGVKVTEIKLTINKNKEVQVEKALFPEDEINIITTIKIKNKNGKVIEENIELIGPKGISSTQLDTDQDEKLGG